MKMPSRPYYPPMVEETDIFGLGRITILGEACESDAERQNRIDKVTNGVEAAFNTAVHHLGDTKARELFALVTRRPKRGLGKAHVSDRDHRLLKAFDEAMFSGETIAALSRRLFSTTKGLGSTEQAIAAQIRKLRDERTKRAKAYSIEVRRWRMAMRNEPPTLLGAATTRNSR